MKITPNLLIQEVFDDYLVPWAREVVHGGVVIRDGYLEIPDRPGIGATLDETAAAKHPYGPQNFLRLFERGWEMRGQR